MTWHLLSIGLAQYLCVVIVITLHEFGHAWMAWRCGDDTARMLGRVTLNPIAHIDPIGTVALPLLSMLLVIAGYGQLASFIIGWGKPVPVDYRKLRNEDRDSLMIAMAGPAMNVLLMVAVMIVVKLAFVGGQTSIAESGVLLAEISMFLFFFNLIPVPPLDGSHILRVMTRMSWETFANMSRFGFFVVIVLIQLPLVNTYLSHFTAASILSVERVLKISSGDL
jgi:Zn-dependent protease